MGLDSIRSREILLRLAVAVIGLCVALTPGCVNPKTGGKTVLRVATWGGAGDDSEFTQTVRRLRREFEAENPGVEVREEAIPGPGEYVRKLLLSFIAGTEPDIITLDASSAAVFIENGVLLDLQPMIDRDPEFNLGDYYENVVNIARRGKELYAIPGDFTPMVLYYNRKLFDEAGVAYPTENWTFADFLNAAKALTKPNQYGFKFSNWMPGWIVWLWNNGGDVLNAEGTSAVGSFDSKASVEAVEFLRDLVKKHKVAPSLSETAAQGVDLFANGQAAMEVSGHWAMIGYQNAPKGKDGNPRLDIRDVGVARLPTQLRSSVTVMYEAGFAIGRNSKNRELAWKYVKYMSSYRVQKEYNATGIAISARKDVSQENAKDERARAFLAIIPSARPPWGPIVEGYENVERVGESEMNAIIAGSKPPAEALADAARRIDKDFARR